MMRLIPELVVAVLWGIAAVTTAIVTSDTGNFGYLGPVFAICAIGSVLTVRWSRGKANGP
jgi:hypothetical protein